MLFNISLGTIINILLLLKFGCTGKAKNSVEGLYILNKFEPENAEFNHLAVDEKLEYVYIGAKNR